MTIGTSTAHFVLLATALTLLTPLALQAQAGFTPPPPHVNAPPVEIKRMPGDGNGAYKTGKYRDLFTEQGHPAAETKARLEKPSSSSSTATPSPSASTSKPAKTKTAPSAT
jgi:hypothetical protein